MNWVIDPGSDLRCAHEQASQSEAAVKSLLLTLISRATETPRLCSEVAPIVRDALEAAGLTVEEHFPQSGNQERFPILLGWAGQRSTKPDILLCAHLDTSPAGEGWSRNPYGEEHDGFIFGRGSVVSKSDVAVFIHAASAAHVAMGGKEDISLVVAITSDEGSGGEYGAAYILEELGLRPRVAVFAGVSDVVTIAHNGCVQVKILLVGASCHQSLLQPREDAMRHATTICAALYAVSDEIAGRCSAIPGISSPTLNITKVVGGHGFGMSPRVVEIWVDRRVIPDESVNAARDELLDRILSLRSMTDVRTEVDVVRIAEPMRPSKSQDHFVQLLQNEAYVAFGKTLRAQGSTLYTDARWFSNAGIPTVMYGAGEADIKVSGANGNDERIPERCLREATVILARAIVRYCANQQQ